MAIITIPADVAATIGGQNYGQARYDIVEVSEPTGSSAVRLLGPPRWRAGLRSMRGIKLAQAGAWEAMLLQLRGGINMLAVYDFARPTPAGIMRGASALNASAALGATSVVIAGARGTVNLLPYGRSIDAAAWTGTATVTANTDLAPGSMTAFYADTIADSSTTLTQNRIQSITVPNDSATYNISIYVKQTSGGTAPSFSLGTQVTGGTTALSNNPRLNTDTGEILFGNASSTLIGGYWRISAPITNNSTGNTTLSVILYPAIAAYGNFTADITQTGSKVVYGAQISLGSNLQDYETFAGYLAPGDWLQIGTGIGTSQLVKCILTAACNSLNGLVTATFEPPLRYAFTAGTAVICEQPVGYYRMSNDALSWSASPNGPAIDGFSIDLLEAWG